MLPQAFLDRMEQMLGEEYPAFLQSYEEGALSGIARKSAESRSGCV